MTFICLQLHAWGANQKQREKIDSLRQVVAASKIDTVIAKSMHELGRTYRRINSDTPFWCLQQLIAFAEKKTWENMLQKDI